MKRTLIPLLAVLASACGMPTELPESPTISPSPLRSTVIFDDNGEFNFSSTSGCVQDGTDIVCSFRVENAGPRSGVQISVYGYWSADAQCLHAKTLKPAPAQIQPGTVTPIWANYLPEAAVPVTDGEAEVSDVRLSFDGYYFNPCSKGPYTVVQWREITMTGWLLIAFDDPEFGSGYASALDPFLPPETSADRADGRSAAARFV